MLNPCPPPRAKQTGFSMLEVLITIVILAFGMLGLAGLQMKTQSAEMESYQRAQALVLLNDIVERINANSSNAVSYVSATPSGTGDSQPASCSGLAMGAARDLCEWSNALKGSAEASGSAKVGSMIGARGCIAQLQAPDTSPGVCTPGIYRAQVVWQGLNPTVAPNFTCGQGLYGNDALRRLVSKQFTVGLPLCT